MSCCTTMQMKDVRRLYPILKKSPPPMWSRCGMGTGISGGRKVDNIDLHHLLEAGEYGEACRRYPYCHCGSKMDLEDENNDD